MANDDFAIGAVGDKKSSSETKGSEAAGSSQAASSASQPQQAAPQADAHSAEKLKDKVSLSDEAKGLE